MHETILGWSMKTTMCGLDFVYSQCNRVFATQFIESPSLLSRIYQEWYYDLLDFSSNLNQSNV